MDRLLIQLINDELKSGDFVAHHAWEVIKDIFVTHFLIHVNMNQLRSRLVFYKTIYLICQDLQHNAGFTWDDKNKVFVGRDISWNAYNESNVEFKKILDKPFPYKRELDILCGKTTVRGCHFMGSTQDVDVESRRSFGDDDSVGREQFNAMGLESNHIYSVDDDNFNPFFYPPSSQYYPSSQPIRDKTLTNNQPNEDEATSPEKRQSTPTYMVSRKRKSKKPLDPMALAQYCMLNNEQINMAKNLFPGSSSAPSAQQEHNR
ncbi:hypothetical protein Taro_056592, partial [Colocasia esculenta]|nr:hypothetical protein [Colocasia esculenta]